MKVKNKKQRGEYEARGGERRGAGYLSLGVAV
jgi:hypothetical protein